LSNQPAFCVHGHFYQPPREDPITGEIPLESGAAPYRNWNEKIFYDCYKPNAEVGNFERISFNIGPTLCQWMAEFEPATLKRIVEQENRCHVRYGIGNGMAQAYNHTILPLMSRRDKVTQIRWGLMDFQHWFGHAATGMWLPETAVDMETLEVMAENGVQFTILAPWQADQSGLDVTQPYTVHLPGGKKITVFFYEQDLSTRISFDPIATTNADLFSRDFLLPKFLSPNHHRPMVLTASDGELYGHHQPFREKFLNFLFTKSLQEDGIEWTFPGLWMRQHPPQRSVKILENTSWSCHHGVTRWSGDCSCTPHSSWKKPFRDALLKLAWAVDDIFVKEMTPWAKGDVWEWRDAYSQVLLREVPPEVYVAQRAGQEVAPVESQKIQWLLQAQYERQRMFTSCGWFFDDFDRIEPQNNVAYAASAVWRTLQATGINLEGQVVEWLRPVKSWRSGLEADAVFLQYIQRAHTLQVLPIQQAV